jgi:hypothetical protein
MALTLLLLGGAMVLLGGAWHAVRRVLVAPFPKRGLVARIIPPEPAAEAEGGDEEPRTLRHAEAGPIDAHFVAAG